MSPFAGANDEETLRNVQKCDWNFDDESFRNVSDEGKDFIKKLLMLEPEYVLFLFMIDYLSKMYDFKKSNDNSRSNRTCMAMRRCQQSRRTISTSDT